MSFTQKQKPIFALDLGTSKFCVAGLYRDALTTSPRLEFISVAAQGMSRGMLSDLGKAQSALNELLEVSESQLNMDIEKVVVGVAGGHLDAMKARASMNIQNEPAIGPQTLARLSRQVEQQNQRSGKEILHTVPLYYQIDQRQEIDNPVGFSGHWLHAEYLLIYADQAYLKDIIRTCNNCGLQVVNLYAEPFASACVTTTEEQKELGVVIADIGGGTTDGLVFQKGKPVGLFTVNVAGFMMTKDLAIGLNLATQEAERVKLYFGLRCDNDGQGLEVKNLRGETRVIIWRDVFTLLSPRVRELAAMIVDKIIAYKGLLGGGLLLTGGGSEVKFMDSFLNDILKIPVTRIQPELKIAASLNFLQSHTDTPHIKKVESTKFATALGLINLEIGRRRSAVLDQKQNWSSRYIHQFVNWLRELSE